MSTSLSWAPMSLASNLDLRLVGPSPARLSLAGCGRAGHRLAGLVLAGEGQLAIPEPGPDAAGQVDPALPGPAGEQVGHCRQMAGGKRTRRAARLDRGAAQDPGPDRRRDRRKRVRRPATARVP